MVVGVGIMTASAVTGVNSVIFYWQIILNYSGSTIHPYLYAITNALINVLVTIVAMSVIDTRGRKTLLSTGTAIMTVSMVLIGCGFVVWGLTIDDDTGTLTGLRDVLITTGISPGQGQGFDGLSSP